MSKVEIYTTKICAYCVRAKSLLKKKGVDFTEIDVSTDDRLRESMMDRAGGRSSVPQIFINDQHIGGSDDLYALEKANKLDELLAVKG